MSLATSRGSVLNPLAGLSTFRGWIAIVLWWVAAMWASGCSDRSERVEQLLQPTREELVAATEDFVDFLRGRAPTQDLRLARTVTLYLGPDGGGESTTFRSEDLDRPTSWRVPSRDARHTYSFVPPSNFTELETYPGKAVNCLRYELKDRVRALAKYPHVGAVLARPGSDTCLSTWNVTFVFEPLRDDAVLRAAVYDQWEW